MKIFLAAAISGFIGWIIGRISRSQTVTTYYPSVESYERSSDRSSELRHSGPSRLSEESLEMAGW